MPQSVGSPLLWVGFTAGILCVLALDLGVFHRNARVVRPAEALKWVCLWIALALGFCAWIFVQFGSTRGMEFLAGYLIEYALSVDNIFVFLVIFSYFSVPTAFQHRVLFWGVLGAIALRAVFILAGATLLQSFHWVIFLFGGLLVVTGIKLLVQRSDEVHPERNLILRLFRRVVPTVPEYHGARFMLRRYGRWYATPLLLVLIAVEATDLMFAVDSIPAILAVTRDPFIVYTSNLFAILGLRSLYFLLSGIMDRFRYLKVGLGLVLVFVGFKMLISEHYQIPIGLSLAVVSSLLGGSVLASLVRPPSALLLPEHRHGEEHHAPPFPEEAREPSGSGSDF
ncbi:MAG: TerC family protein [Armatimonadetes bacterium]|nr:TerC family protein [Armatimonadota bacterium]